MCEGYKELKMAKLTKETFKKIASAALTKVASNGADFYGWKNAPQVDEAGNWTQEQGWGGDAKQVSVTPTEAVGIFEAKINGAYGERFVMSLGTISALIANGYSVRMVQFQEEVGAPFDATGWTVIVIETMPIFHIAPWDLDASELSDVVEVLQNNEAPDVSWKGTNKVGEFNALLMGSIEPGLDLVKIAQDHSK
jgi:hypothetical protein